MKNKDLQTAQKYGIYDKVKNLEDELLEIEGVIYDQSANGVDIDLDGFHDLQQVIIVPAYKIDVTLEDYFTKRGEMLHKIIEVCGKLGLTSSGDRIEDYGAHYYIVRNCNWKTEE